MTTLERFRSAARFPALDGIRALAVLLVIGFHARVPSDRLFVHGGYGVQLFFALSGFLITTLLLRERRQTGRVDIWAFVRRRTARILPAYYAVLALYCVATYLKERGTPAGIEFWGNVPAYLTFTSNWLIPIKEDGGRTIFIFSWSLAVEEQFYLIWPWVVRALSSLAAPVLIALAAATGHWYFTAIGLGSAGALLLDDDRTATSMARIFGHRSSLPITFAGVLCVLLVADNWPTWANAPIATAFVIAAALEPRSILGRALSLRWLRFLGGISYGMYLLHSLALHAVARVLPPGYFALALGTIVTIIAASLSYYLFELPIQRWARSPRSEHLQLRLTADNQAKAETA